ncbi:hypothetical protein GGS21DRAFT_110464 [Xylaria nigripes]|nr:hypothetical protein GGS21DRAFT_110464 [Xylaria nigripes]
MAPPTSIEATFEDVEDFSSTPGVFDLFHILLSMGVDCREYVIHAVRLGPLANHLRRLPRVSSHSVVRFADWDREIFNLAMNWSYRKVMPRICDLSGYFQAGRNLDIKYRANIREAPIDADAVQPAESQRSPTIPIAIPDEVAIKAEKEQILLLKLMIFADSFRWEGLFNDAIDAYMYGETMLRRSHLPLSHFLVAFNEIFDGPKHPTLSQQFIIDHAIQLGYKNKKTSLYRDELLDYPHITAIFLGRLDRNVSDGTAGDQLIVWANPPKPAFELAHPYHMHQGIFSFNCACTCPHCISGFRGSRYGVPVTDGEIVVANYDASVADNDDSVEAENNDPNVDLSVEFLEA